ncbi:MAG: HAD family hydrolase [Propionibacteriaceae bacterium]|jgi:pyrophosphatase PpaX|nr:HAD family hydrolase [Propionibacteriaceae bacterium]
MPGKAVLFDLDGTLADTVPLLLESYARTAQQVLGVPADLELHRRWIGRPLRDTFENIYGPEHVEAMVAAYDEINVALTVSDTREFPGIRDLLIELAQAGVAVGVATAKRAPAAKLTLAAAQLAGVVEVVASAEDTDAHKPSPEPLLKAAAALGAQPCETAYVGDAVTDIQAAKAAGMKAVAVSWGAATAAELAAENPDALAATVAELRAILLG